MSDTARIGGGASIFAPLAITIAIAALPAACGEDDGTFSKSIGVTGADGSRLADAASGPADAGVSSDAPADDGATVRPGNGGGGDPVNPNDPALDAGQKGDEAPSPNAAGGPAHDVVIDQIALYQAVKIPLMKDGTAAATLNAPIVKNRPGLLRIFVDTNSGFEPRQFVARLSISGKPDKEVTARVGGPSSDDDLGTTFNFELTADDLGQDWKYSVSLHELASAQQTTGSTDGSAWPDQGTATLEPESSGPSIKIAFIPIKYNGDGSGRLPDTSDDQLKYLADKMMSTYPVAKVEYTLHAPMNYNNGIGSGSGWNSALNAICVTRQNDDPPSNVYYYGLIAPADSLQDYCGNGCVTGIALLAQGANDVTSRCAMGLDYAGKGSGVFMQEVAHNMSRMHAPCGNVSGVDQGFPYPNAKIGVWGYDMLSKALVDPTTTVDFMSYCNPVWVSDYTYSALFKRLVAVNAAATPDIANGPLGLDTAVAAATAAAPLRVINVEADGSLSWGGEVRVPDPSGAAIDVTLRDQGGRATTVQGSYHAHSDGKGGMIVVPARDASAVVDVKLPDRGFQNIAPTLGVTLAQ